jgi:hypothetical protein
LAALLLGLQQLGALSDIDCGCGCGLCWDSEGGSGEEEAARSHAIDRSID